MLFKPERFSQFAHVPVSKAEWIEPISGARDLGYRKWVAEKDPMISEANKPDMIEGPIILGHRDRGSRRHFVCGELVYSGCYIEIKFGGGWIPGRYEYLSTESQIRIISTGGTLSLLRSITWYVLNNNNLEGSPIKVAAVPKPSCTSGGFSNS